ncbi:uncharacterized protein [Linepithema humile]|uniref:uncharacterized protein n=1 Tax=Linepithema humile TaxID=83485 RepID=UPI00351EF687
MYDLQETTGFEDIPEETENGNEMKETQHTEETEETDEMENTHNQLWEDNNIEKTQYMDEDDADETEDNVDDDKILEEMAQDEDLQLPLEQQENFMEDTEYLW